MPRMKKVAAPDPAPAPVAPPSGYETVRAAAGRLGIPVQKLRNAVSNRREFKAPGAVIRVPIEGSELTITYLNPASVNAYRDANERGADRGAARLRGGKRRWIIRVAPEDEGAIRAALAAFGVDLEIASAPKKPKAEAPELVDVPSLKDRVAALLAATGEADEGPELPEPERPYTVEGFFTAEEIAALEDAPEHT